MKRPRHPDSGWHHACLAIWLLLCLLLDGHAAAYIATSADGPRSQWARWEAWAKKVQADHQRQLQRQAAQRTERAYVAQVQAACGPDAWFRPRAGAAPVCTDKRGRVAGQPYTGDQP